MADQNMIVWDDRRKALCKTITHFQVTLAQKTGILEELPAAAAALAKVSKVNRGTTTAMPQAPEEEVASIAVAEGESGPRNGRGVSGYLALSAEEQQDALNLLNLVECLKQFAEDQFEFFFDGFVGSDFDKDKKERKHKKFLLNPSREFPPEHVFSVTLNQIAEDLEVIRRAADQRLSPESGLKLREADRLAWSALKPAVDSKLIEDDNATVMTYFQKSASIRIIPYAPVALVAIPFTATEVKRDYLALPHEVGHYVYRHGKIEGKSIPQALGQRLMELDPPSPRWARRWKEEIFADLYGCLIGGPVTALSFLDLARQSSRTQIIHVPGEYLYGSFTEDDGVHPVSVVRPYVYSNVLRRMIWAKSADLLDNAWGKLPQVQETTEFRTRYAGASAEYIKVETAKTEINRIIRVIFELFQANALFRTDWSNNPDGDSLNELYEKFEETGAYKNTGVSYIIGTTPAPKALEKPYDLWNSWVKKEKFFPGIDQPPQKKKEEEPEKLIAIDPGEADRLEALEQEPRYTWNHVFLAGGWATKGPGTSGSNGILFPRNWQGTNGAGSAGGGAY